MLSVFSCLSMFGKVFYRYSELFNTNNSVKQARLNMFCCIIIISIAYFLWKADTFSSILRTIMVLRHLVLVFCVNIGQKQDFTASMTEDPGKHKTLN